MQNYQTEKFALSASPAAADGYPAEIYQGNFIRSDGKRFPVPSGNFLTSGWSGSGRIGIAPYAALILSREG